jgi:predicted ATPase
VLFGDYHAPVNDINWLAAAGRRPGAPRKAVLEVNNVASMVQTIKSGLGIGSLPSWMGADLDGLVKLLPEVQRPKVDCYFVYPEELRSSKRVAVFRDFLLARLQESKWGSKQFFFEKKNQKTFFTMGAENSRYFAALRTMVKKFFGYFFKKELLAFWAATAGKSMAVWNSRNFLVEMSVVSERIGTPAEYPFNIPAINGLDVVRFNQPVTFFIGENGAGKSTLLEGIAVASGLNAEGGSRNFRFATRSSHSGLHDCLRLTRSARRVRDRYFLRAESYFNVATEIENLDNGGSGPRVIDSYGGKSLHEQSHGESFFALFMNRFRGDGFYILDEPEAALSPSRQLAFLSRLHDLVSAGSQFLIATHSPILMAYPNAEIFMLADGPPYLIDYVETEHYTVTRAFLTRTDSMLAQLMGEGGAENAPD